MVLAAKGLELKAVQREPRRATRMAYLEDGGPGRKGGGGAAARALQGPAGCPRQCLKETPTESVSSGVRECT